MNKPIIHFQIPIRENSRTKNDLAIRPMTMAQFMQVIKNNIGDKYDLICSPFELVEADKSVDIVTVKNITMKDVERIIKEGNNERICLII